VRTMVKKLTVAFDVDGVLRNLVEYTISYLTDNGFLVGQSIADVNHYDAFVELIGGKEKWRECLDSIHAWKEAPVNQEMLAVWRYCNERYNTIIVTSNSHLTGQMETVEWLHGALKPSEGLDIYFTNDKLSVEWDAIFEDSLHNASVASMRKRMAFLVKRPWTDPRTDRKTHRWNIDFLIGLPEDHEAMPIIHHVLAWLEGYREGKDASRRDQESEG
jgi:5'(3')-deoxyribonucleotidase